MRKLLESPRRRAGSGSHFVASIVKAQMTVFCGFNSVFIHQSRAISDSLCLRAVQNGIIGA